MPSPELSRMRSEYGSKGLEQAEASNDPFSLWGQWLSDAIAAQITEPNAMALATASAAGVPSVRIVLLKGMSEQGAVFFTNYESRKGEEIEANPYVAADMLWHDMGRQVRFEGTIERLPAEESDRYFESRPEGARLGAIASPQSRVIADREELERLRDEAQKQAIARPAHWGGYLIRIERWEFWQGREDRLHDRIVFQREGSLWSRVRLAP